MDNARILTCIGLLVTVTVIGPNGVQFRLKSGKLFEIRGTIELAELQTRGGEGVFPIVCYSGRLRPEGVPF